MTITVQLSATAGPITISSGATSQTITITVNHDALNENSETVIVTMGVPTNATRCATTVHTPTITDSSLPGARRTRLLEIRPHAGQPGPALV